MLGAIIGDIVGSRFEFDPIKDVSFKLFDKRSSFTDDTVMTLAIASALLEANINDLEDVSKKAIINMQALGRKYPDVSYGGMFSNWIKSDNPKPYNSYGNGSAMRISSVAYVSRNKEELDALVLAVTKVTHNHEEGIKGALAIANAIFMALNGSSKDEIRSYINDNYYKLNFTINDIKATYCFDSSCQGSVPMAIEAFLESTDFIDAIKKAISLGGDSDTIGAMCGSIAEAYYGIEDSIKEKALTYLPDELLKIYFEFIAKYY